MIKLNHNIYVKPNPALPLFCFNLKTQRVVKLQWTIIKVTRKGRCQSFCYVLDGCPISFLCGCGAKVIIFRENSCFLIIHDLPPSGLLATVSKANLISRRYDFHRCSKIFPPCLVPYSLWFVLYFLPVIFTDWRGQCKVSKVWREWTKMLTMENMAFSAGRSTR